MLTNISSPVDILTKAYSKIENRLKIGVQNIQIFEKLM